MGDKNCGLIGLVSSKLKRLVDDSKIVLQYSLEERAASLHQHMYMDAMPRLNEVKGEFLGE